MVRILSNQDGTRVVELSEQCGFVYRDIRVKRTLMAFTHQVVTLQQSDIQSDTTGDLTFGEQPVVTSFRLTHLEMAALVEAYQAYWSSEEVSMSVSGNGLDDHPF